MRINTKILTFLFILIFALSVFAEDKNSKELLYTGQFFKIEIPKIIETNGQIIYFDKMDSKKCSSNVHFSKSFLQYLKSSDKRYMTYGVMWRTLKSGKIMNDEKFKSVNEIKLEKPGLKLESSINFRVNNRAASKLFIKIL